MDGNYFKKVFIKDVSDLPKESGWYFVHWKHPDERLHTQMGHQYYDGSIKGLWFGKDWFDWYLIESPISVPTEEEVKKVSSELEYQGFVHELTELKDKFLIFTKWGFEKGAKWAINETLKRNECVTK